MTQEEKYKQALKRAKELLDDMDKGDYFASNEDIENIFPELKEKESKGERIRKELIEQIAYIIPNNDEVDDEGNALPSYQERINKYRAWLEKQGEQKSVDKVEPKFKVGDWFVNNNRKDVFLIKSINTNRYCTLEDIKGNIISPCLPPCESDSHIWTIQDAKDGDVLVCDINKAEIGGDVEKLPNITPTICIYQNVVKDKDYIHTYCSLYNESSLIVSNSMYYNTFVYNIHPATKEQQDLLFAKMKEAGYEWDAEKKEVKQIEPKKLDADKVIEWLKNTIKERAENYGVYKATRLILPYNSIEDLINDFK